MMKRVRIRFRATLAAILLPVLTGIAMQVAEVKATEEELSESQVRELAQTYKAKWVKDNPSESEVIGPAIIQSVERTPSGWHVVFEHVTDRGQPEGEAHRYLHIYINSSGKLERVVRGPDAIARAAPQQRFPANSLTLAGGERVRSSFLNLPRDLKSWTSKGRAAILFFQE